MSFLFGQIQRQFIARPEQAKDLIVYKWPEDNIRRKSQLTVEADERAVFVKRGVVQGVVSPGRYPLDGADIPFLGSLIDAATGGRALLSELYFVTTREIPGLLFGGSLDTITDPSTKLLARLAVNGDYALRVTDGISLITNLIGTEQVQDDKITDWVRDQLTKVMKNSVIGHILRESWPIFGISAYTSQMEQDVLHDVQQNLAPYGLTVTRFGNFTVAVDPDDLQKIEAFVTRTQAISQQAQGSVTRLAAADALEGFGQGAAKGSSEGLGGLILGAGLGQTLQGALGVGVAAPPPPATPAPPPPAPAPDGSTFCGNCGQPIPALDKFCPHCGHPVA